MGKRFSRVLIVRTTHLTLCVCEAYVSKDELLGLIKVRQQNSEEITLAEFFPTLLKRGIMSGFQYVAVDSQGVRQQGTLAVASRRVAIQSLIQQGLTPLTVCEEIQKTSRSNRVPIGAVCAFYAKLADLISAEVPLLQSLKITVEVTTHQELKGVLQQVQTQVADGKNFASVLAEHPHIFNSFGVSVIRAGLEGAFLDQALHELVEVATRQQMLRSKVRGAVAYPAFLVVVGIVMLVGMLGFFVPRFAPMFEGLRQRGELPWMTEALFELSRNLGQYWLYLLIGAVGVGVGLVRWLRSAGGKRMMAASLLRLGFVGDILAQIGLAKFSRLLSALLKNGVTIDRALRLCSTSIGNPIFEETIVEATEKIEKGGTLSAAFKEKKWIPVDFSEMVTVGEKTNRLCNVLATAAENYERQTTEKMNVMLRFLEPILLLLMGAVITFFVFTLLLPILQSSSLVE